MPPHGSTAELFPAQNDSANQVDRHKGESFRQACRCACVHLRFKRGLSALEDLSTQTKLSAGQA